jgi:hypothetical protein
MIAPELGVVKPIRIKIQRPNSKKANPGNLSVRSVIIPTSEIKIDIIRIRFSNEANFCIRPLALKNKGCIVVKYKLLKLMTKILDEPRTTLTMEPAFGSEYTKEYWLTASGFFLQ